VRLRRAAGPLLATLGVATWYLARRRSEPPVIQADGPRTNSVTRGDALDRLAAEVEARSDAVDVVSVVEDLLTEPGEEERKPG
jgi:hypothetical protein